MELGLPLARRPLCPRRTSKKRNQGSSPRLSRSICPRRRRLDAANSRQVGLFRCVGAYYLMRWEGASEGRLLTYSTNASKTCLRALLYTHSLSGRVSLIDTYGGCGRVVVGVRSIKLRCPASVFQFRLLLISDSASHKVQARALGPGLSSDPPATPWLHQVRSTARGSTRRLHLCGEYWYAPARLHRF